MSEEEVVSKAQKGALWLGKHWFWIVLIGLIIAGCYLTASYLWNLNKGSKKKEAKT